MKCKYCSDEMEVVFHDDNGGGCYKDQCYKIYACDNPECMTICREDLWENKGERWVSPENE